MGTQYGVDFKPEQTFSELTSNGFHTVYILYTFCHAFEVNFKIK